MLNQLLETKPEQRRRLGGTMVSFVVHAVLIAGAIGVTQRNLVALTKPEEQPVHFQPVRPEPVPERPRAPDRVHRDAPAPFGHQTLAAPVTIDIGIPPVDLSAAPTNAGDFTGRDAPGGRPDGDVGASGPVTIDAPLQVFDVDKAAAMVPGSPAPAYPALLKASGIEGEALVQFVVDTAGRAELPSFRVLQSTHEAFGGSVRSALAKMRFVPAEAGGRKVRMLVQQRFAFALVR